MLNKLGLIIAVLFLSFTSIAQTNLIKIQSSIEQNNIYQVKLTLDQKTSFNISILSNPNRVAIDFYNSNLSLTSPPNQLNSYFLKNILKSNSKDNNLRITLELSTNAKFNRTYSNIQNGKLIVIIQLKNDKLPANYTKAISTNKELSSTKKIASIKKTIIMIDPGHGGVDNGTIGSYFKTKEKKLTLDYALALKKELTKYPQYKVLLTREKDISLTRDERKNKARKAKADLFISIHADFNSNPTLHGASVYTLSQEGYDEDSTALTERENNEDILKNNNLLKQNESIANVIIDMVYQDTHNASKRLANIIIGELTKEVQTLDKSNRSAGLRVLKIADIPAILIEVGYLSNLKEEKLLNSSNYKKRFIQALVASINQYNSRS